MVPLVFTRRLSEPPSSVKGDGHSLQSVGPRPTADHRNPDLTLSLTAAERTRSRYRFTTPSGQDVLLQLPRGTVLHHQDLLQTETGEVILQIQAQPEPVLTVRATTDLNLLRAAYHLGNRHVPLEITPTCLRLAPDPVLEQLLERLGMLVTKDLHPFQPEAGAYGHAH